MTANSESSQKKQPTTTTTTRTTTQSETAYLSIKSIGMHFKTMFNSNGTMVAAYIHINLCCSPWFAVRNQINNTFFSFIEQQKLRLWDLKALAFSFHFPNFIVGLPFFDWHAPLWEITIHAISLKKLNCSANELHASDKISFLECQHFW